MPSFKLSEEDIPRVEQLTREGKTQKEIGAEFGVDQMTVSRFCRRHNIAAANTDALGKTGRRGAVNDERRRKVQERAEEQIREEVAQQDPDTIRRLGYEEGVIEASAQEQARVMRLHRTGATETRQTIMGMLAELQAMGTSREKLQQLIEMVATWESQQDPDIDFDEQDRRRENAIKTFSKMLTLDVRADTAKKLVDSMVKIVDLERRVYGIKDDTGETDTVRALKELING